MEKSASARVGNRKGAGEWECSTRVVRLSFSRKLGAQVMLGVPAGPLLLSCALSLQGRVWMRPTHRRRFMTLQVLFMPCASGRAHFFIFLFFLCRLRMRFLAHLSLIVISNNNYSSQLPSL